jgi:hypothetical protein
MRNSCFGQVKRSVDVGAKRFVPFLGRDICDLPISPLKCRIVREDIDLAELTDSAVDECLAMILRLDIAGNDDCFPSGLSYLVCSVFCVLVLIQVEENNFTSLASERNCDRSANTGI